MPPEPEYPDGLPHPPAKGRGAGINPGNRFEKTRLHVSGDFLEDERGDISLPTVQVGTQIIADATRTIINHVDPEKSPDIPFEFSVNPYRGCEHGCIYCYARPGHEALGYSSGLDFETKIIVKHDAPGLLRKELASPRWRPRTIALAGVTDVYQPIEAKLRITRGCLEVLAECRQPVGIVTKNRLVLRDMDLLQELAAHHAVRVAVSVTTLDRKLAAAMEPRTTTPGERLETIRRLSAAGIPTLVMVAPVIPGLTDREMPEILRAAAESGAKSAGYVLLRLPYQIKSLFEEWLTRNFPDRAAHVLSLIRQTRGGELYDSTHGVRMRGEGEVAGQIQRMFEVFTRRHGLRGGFPPMDGAAFRRPEIAGQMRLFQT